MYEQDITGDQEIFWYTQKAHLQRRKGIYHDRFFIADPIFPDTVWTVVTFK